MEEVHHRLPLPPSLTSQLQESRVRDVQGATMAGGRRPVSTIAIARRLLPVMPARRCASCLATEVQFRTWRQLWLWLAEAEQVTHLGGGPRPARARLGLSARAEPPRQLPRYFRPVFPFPENNSPRKARAGASSRHLFSRPPMVEVGDGRWAARSALPFPGVSLGGSQ